MVLQGSDDGVGVDPDLACPVCVGHLTPGGTGRGGTICPAAEQLLRESQVMERLVDQCLTGGRNKDTKKLLKGVHQPSINTHKATHTPHLHSSLVAVSVSSQPVSTDDHHPSQRPPLRACLAVHCIGQHTGLHTQGGRNKTRKI